MNNPTGIHDEEEKPLDPAVENIRRRMVRLLVISISIMMIGLMAVLAAIVYKINSRDDSPPVPTIVKQQSADKAVANATFGKIQLPKSGRLVASSLNGNRLLLTVETDGKKQLLIFDMVTATIVARYDIVN